MLILPGLKFVQLTGTLKKLVPAETCRVTNSPTTPTQRATAQATRHLKNEIKGHQDKAHSFESRAERTFKGTKGSHSCKQLASTAKNTTDEQRSFTIDQSEFKCINKVEYIKIDNSLLEPDGYSFSSTDNSLVTMTGTVGFKMDRFKFHFYNKYSALQEVSEDEQELRSSALMWLPRPYKVHTTEVDYKSGAQKIRRNLQRAKNSTEKSQQTTEIEASLSQLDISRARDVKEFKKCTMRTLNTEIFCGSSTFHHNELSKKGYMNDKNVDISTGFAQRKVGLQYLVSKA
ncbi:hypothetical protein G6F70_009078 [Rhizopus microsporus]|nr:hypothetical protein G6F71_009026 [Rhizopus microsporus]KAG1193405.1 hypothetical protein G6F70_009078 [Rhizopus microsporus]KAG1206136.1 hypothetical protein G6F69_009052 [Rhizopus microsporus]KAG1226279.1 hypothetical protein G6F67_009045 [Rhizopus microsporus]KAG1257828.1 hypothetical protein G6F68_009118 [Rhizopus microsporus]